MEKDEHFMSEALKEARKALKKCEVPVGCVVVHGNKIIARAHNRTIRDNDPTAHAEILAMRKAAKKTKNYRLTSCDIYVTIEPCAMCAGAMVWARIGTLFFGACDKRAGACGSIFNIVRNENLNHRVGIRSGLLASECAGLMKNFFKKKRIRSQVSLPEGRPTGLPSVARGLGKMEDGSRMMEVKK